MEGYRIYLVIHRPISRKQNHFPGFPSIERNLHNTKLIQLIVVRKGCKNAPPVPRRHQISYIHPAPLFPDRDHFFYRIALNKNKMYPVLIFGNRRKTVPTELQPAPCLQFIAFFHIDLCHWSVCPIFNIQLHDGTEFLILFFEIDSEIELLPVAEWYA